MSNIYIAQKALIACSRLVDFAGAEISTIEIALALREMGFNVEIASLEIHSPIQKEIEYHSLKYVDLSKTELINELYDLVWVCHFPTAYNLYINNKISSKISIYSSLSHFEPLEAPPLSNIIFSKYLVNSQENKEFFINRYPDLENKTTIFYNSAPDEFFTTDSIVNDSNISSVAIISNHPPQELYELKSILLQHGILIEIIGIHGTPARVTPQLLRNFSAVITIGKTVQYCMAAEIPVYCYDYFGGPGWITEYSFEEALSKNFSGRCTPEKKSAEAIFEELFSGYPLVKKQRAVLKEIARNKFHLPTNIRSLLTSIEVSQTDNLISNTDKEILSNESKLFVNLRSVIANFQYGKNKLEEEIFELNSRIKDLDAHALETSKIINTYEMSLKEINDKYNSLLSKIEFLEQQETEHKKIEASYLSNSAKKSEVINSLSYTIECMRTEYLSSHEVISTLELSNSELTKKLNDQTGKYELLENELKSKISAEKILNEKIEIIYASTSWKITEPPRFFISTINTLVDKTTEKISWFKFLLKRSYSTLIHQGPSALVLKINLYAQSVYRRKLVIIKSIMRPSHPKNTIIETNENPLFSFVIPIYDRTDTLRSAINSALNQTYKNIEVILITDGSPPETLAVVNEYLNNEKVKIFNYPTSSGNAVRGRNKGIIEARGSYIAFLDSDDIAEPKRIESSLLVLKSGNTDVVYGAWRALIDGTRDISGLVDGQIVLSPDCDLTMLEQICVPCQSTVTVRKSIFERAGFLKAKMKYREDHELWARLAYFGAKFKSISTPLVTLRLHSGNNELNFKNDDAHWSLLFKNEYKKKGIIPKKIAFIVAGLGISGGLVVILKHASYLMSIGHDVFIINTGEEHPIDWSGQKSIPIIRIDDKRSYIFDNIDILFSTFWATCEWLDRLASKRKLYLIQSDERLFYEEPSIKMLVERTYRSSHEFVTIAKWIGEMLQRDFSKSSFLIPNGIDLNLFRPDIIETKGKSSRVRVLIEGPLTIPFKGVADAYAAIECLDCEIWMVSSAGRPDSSWRIDRFFEKVPFNEMSKIYASCDILLKMSRIESFSYPPLEAMACGCSVVVGKVLGSMEYIEDKFNALVVDSGDIYGAREAVNSLIHDPLLRNRLVEEGYRTSKNWSWEKSFEALTSLIEGKSA